VTREICSAQLDADTWRGAMANPIARRTVLVGAVVAIAAATAGTSLAQSSPLTFAQWTERFRPRARARGISEATYSRVMGGIKPDTEVYALQRSQPEFREPMWQYVNRRVSDWRIITGKARAVEHAALIERIEKQYGVDRHLMLGLWGMESAFGDVVVNRKYMRPVIPALAALAWDRTRVGRRKRHDRLMGRRHGPHAVDAGGLAQHGRRQQRRWPRLALRIA
jgi:membrane-bound lytic murein transglycosylase B